jgi:hypothetical protein
MSLTWHIFRKDLYRLRWVILLLVVCGISVLALATIEAGLDAEGHMPFYMAASAFGLVFAPVTSFGLVMGIQDDDPVVAVDAFWMTRPIEGWRLLAAKGIALVVVSVIPIAVDLPFWALHGFGPSLLGAAVLKTLAIQAFIALLALPFAIVSANGSRFVMNVMIGGASFIGLSLLFSLFVPTTGYGSAPAVAVLQSRSVVMLSIWALAAAAMALNQYCRRATRTSVIILAAACVIGLFVSERWNGTVGSSKRPRSHDAANPVTLVVAAEAGAKVETEGFELKIIEIIPNDPRGGVAVEVSESAPDVELGIKEAAEPLSSEHYLLVNRTDGRRMTGEVTRNPEELGAPGLRYFRTSLLFRPDKDLAGNVPPNIATWLKNADLIKDVAPTPNTGSSTTPDLKS